MLQIGRLPLRTIDEAEALEFILKGTSTVTGESFFKALVENLSKALNTYSAWVTEYLKETRQLREIAFWAAGKLMPGSLIDIAGTPCEAVIERVGLVHFPNNLSELYPNNYLLKKSNAVSYMGVPLLDTDNQILGHLAVLDTHPMPKEPRATKIMQIFAARASAELQRLRAEAEVRQREVKFRRIIETAGEGFMLLDREYRITEVNDAMCKMSGFSREEMIGKSPLKFSPESYGDFLRENRKELFSGVTDGFECKLVSKNGLNIPVLVHSNLLKDDDGDIIGKMAFITDLTTQKKSLLLASETQKRLLPQERPLIVGFDIDGRTVSCDEVGGDYFDFFWNQDCKRGEYGVVVGDVMGHGVDAALIMATVRTYLHVNATQCGDAAQVVSGLNRHLALDVLDTSRFMTLFFMKIDRISNKLSWVRAGHEPAMVYDPKNDSFTELKGTGMALGVNELYEYRETNYTGLGYGQVIIIGTDGIWEARDRNGKMYGKKRFQRSIRESAHRNATGIIDDVFKSLNDFTSGRPQSDDTTLVVIKVTKEFDAIGDWII